MFSSLTSTLGSLGSSIARGYTQIQLIDALGRLCKIVHAGRLDEGSHTFRLNNDTFAPGNYYLRIQQGNAQKVEPLMIVL